MIRIDRLLCLLRLTRTRSIAQRLVAEGHIRRNGERVTNDATRVDIGDILTLPLANQVHVIELLSLPERRGPAAEARAHYRQLEPQSLDPAG
ncbi:S4 domain-containing protein [Altererythrobacter sp. ZODW24]|uniref:S4 domain-containing protein n=1 Tax=Altererythrobacter sp. ZODW24 TaxID=2185142 RepID=UPI0031F50778